MRTAAALIIGSEILSGRTVDTNTPFLARELRALGVDLRRVAIVLDDLDDIVAMLRDLAPRHDIVFTSGGVGPTHDDITLQAIAVAFGRRLVRNAAMAELIRSHFHPAAQEAALRMADMPEGANLLMIDSLGIPVVTLENVYVLPGLPSIFEKKVIALREHLREEPFRLHTVFLDLEEVDIAATLFALAARHPALQLGSYPEPEADGYRVKLTLESKDGALVELALAELLAELPSQAIVRVT